MFFSEEKAFPHIRIGILSTCDAAGLFCAKTARTFVRAVYTETRQLAKELNVPRPTVSGWLKGTCAPDIRALAKMAQFFNVSADYLLGLSDTESPDVTVRAVAKYTGLSQRTAERLHFGIDELGCGLLDRGKAPLLVAASGLIQSEAFTQMVDSLSEIQEVAYVERVLKELNYEHLGRGLSEEKRWVERNAMVRELMHLYEEGGGYAGELSPDVINAMDDQGLRGLVISRADTTEENANGINSLQPKRLPVILINE